MALVFSILHCTIFGGPDPTMLSWGALLMAWCMVCDKHAKEEFILSTVRQPRPPWHCDANREDHMTTELDHEEGLCDRRWVLESDQKKWCFVIFFSFFKKSWKHYQLHNDSPDCAKKNTVVYAVLFWIRPPCKVRAYFSEKDGTLYRSKYIYTTLNEI